MPVIKKHQNPLDFVAQHAGSVDGLFDMAVTNGISITDEPTPGTVLEVTELDATTTKVFETANIDVISYNAQAYNRPGGIGYMQIGNDFKVS